MAKQENLKEFIERRLEELGLRWSALTDAGISSMTTQKLHQGVPVKIKEGTKEKLANVLQCSIGDINAALAATTQVTPFGEEVRKDKEEPSVMQMVDKLDSLVKEEYPECPYDKAEQEKKAPVKPEALADVTEPKKKPGTVNLDFEKAFTKEDEEPAKVFRPETKPADESFQTYKSPYEAERQEGEERLRQKLKSLLAKCAAELSSCDYDGEFKLKDLMADFGTAVLQELE